MHVAILNTTYRHLTDPSCFMSRKPQQRTDAKVDHEPCAYLFCCLLFGRTFEPGQMFLVLVASFGCSCGLSLSSPPCLQMERASCGLDQRRGQAAGRGTFDEVEAILSGILGSCQVAGLHLAARSR